MVKKKERNYWKIALISLFVFFAITFLWSYDTTNNYEVISQEWEAYLNLLNDDEILIDQYLQEYESVQSASDISYINAKLEPRLDAYDTHLTEARNFLSQYAYVFSNRAELRTAIDNKIVNSRTTRNSVNVFIQDYNREIEDYNKRVQTVSDLFKLLI